MKKFKNLDATAKRLSTRILSEYNDPAKRRSTIDATKLRLLSIDLLEKAGIPYTEEVSPREQYVHWNGEVLAIRTQMGDHILHELAHFQCAEPRWWKTPEWGMEPGPDGHSSEARATFQTCDNYRKDQFDEESHASLLGIMWERHLGYRFRDNLNSHCWVRTIYDPDGRSTGKDKWENDGAWEAFRWLLEHGYINGAGRPSLVFRDGKERVDL